MREWQKIVPDRVDEASGAYRQITSRVLTINSEQQRLVLSIVDAQEHYILEPLIACMLGEFGAKATPRVELMGGTESGRSADRGTY